MITVSILINGNPVFVRSAVNVTAEGSPFDNYRVDTGEIIQHRKDDGMVVLVHKLLGTIKEQI